LNFFRINGRRIYYDQLQDGKLEIGEFTDFERSTLNFITEWLTGEKEFSIKTSGTSGNPKTLSFSRKQLISSAQRTLDTFGLRSNDKILVCLNSSYVAGKMMLVRGMVGNLQMDIIDPTSNPLEKYNLGSVDFIALVPNQLKKILDSSSSKLVQIKTILVGGAHIHPELQEKCQSLPSRVFHSYATTETLTHQALRSLNGSDTSEIYSAIQQVSFSTDDRSCLVINDKLLDIENLVTNDVVELMSSTSFRWKGRYDNVINSGGIKIQVEETEQLIAQLLEKQEIFEPFCIVAKEDEVLSQKMVLIIQENKSDLVGIDLLNMLRAELPKYHDPKDIIFVPQIFYTKSGKLDRLKNKQAYIDFHNLK